MLKSARLGLIVLTAINLLNYVDRYVVAALVNALTQPAPDGLGLSAAQSGWLASGFIIVYLLTAPLFGSLADRRNRPRLIAVGVAIWALTTAAGAFAGGFASLLAARSLVGVGEAAYGTAAPAMLADLYPRARRGRIFAIFYAAIPLGAAIGFALGGIVEQNFGWRAAFLFAAAPGVGLAALAWLLADPPRGAGDAQDEVGNDAPASRGIGALLDYARLFTHRPYTLAVLGYAAYTFALGALAFWTPDFLQRVHHLSQTDSTVTFGATLAATGLFGTLAGGWLADRLRSHTPQADMWVCAVSMLLAAPLTLLVVCAEREAIYLPALIGAQILLFVSTGPVNTAIINGVAPHQRAKAMAASIVAIHLFGDVPSPPLVGWIADRSSLREGMLLIAAAVLVSGILWLVAALQRHSEPSG
ncbi:MAG: MFS transporter [bacterium]